MLPTLAMPVFRPMPMSRCGLPSASHFFCSSRTRSIILSEVLPEGAAHAALFFFFEKRAVERNEEHVGAKGHRGHGEIEPPAMQKGPIVHRNQRHEQEGGKPHPSGGNERHPNPQRNSKSED